MREYPIDRVLRPLDRFIKDQSTAGLVLFCSAVLAVVLANSSWREAYFGFWEHTLSVQAGSYVFKRDLLHLINDGLMAVFFFVVALELKREFIGGEFAHLRQAMLPLAASVGGMLVPAMIYLAASGAGGEAANGWGITLGTDTAFVLGLLALLGKRIPPAIKAFFLAVAVIDDIASVSVIAFFYTSHLSMANLGLGVLFLLVLASMNLLGVRNMTAYGAVAVGGLWLAFVLSGVHATVAGVLAAFTIPAGTKMSGRSYTQRIRQLADDYDRTKDTPSSLITDEQVQIITKVKRCSAYAETPSQRLEQVLHPWVAFFILPLFALANAGIQLPGQMGAAFGHPVTMGVFLGLVLGKPIGIFGMSWLFVKMGWGRLGAQVHWGHLAAISVMSGLGFTMAIFISELAFDDEAMREAAKLGILFASVVAAVAGTLLFSALRRT